MTSETVPTRRTRADARRTGRMVAWSIAAVVVVLILAAAWVGVRALLAKNELEAAVPLAGTLATQIAAQDTAGATETAAELQAHASEAASLTGDPMWRAAELVPGAGPNLTAVRQLAAVADDLARDVVSPLTAMATDVGLSDLTPSGGAVNVQPIADTAPVVQEASRALATARSDVAAIETAAVIGPVEQATARLAAQLDEFAEPLLVLEKATSLLPRMLGAEGPRDYILMFQNPAELRASGGIPGALALLHTEGGKISLTEQTSASNFPTYHSSVLPLPPETEGIFGRITGEFMQNVTSTPQFAQSGELAREMWKRQYGVEVDGVISVDPVALSYLLEATGPITLATGDVLEPGNAVKLLLSDVYARYSDTEFQDLFFASAAATVFDRISSGEFDPAKLAEALARAGGERRVLIWSAHPDDQAILADTTLAGTLPRSDDDTRRFGVYLNDATGAKMDYHLDVRTAVGQVACREDGRPYTAVEVTLTNTAPVDAATSLPPYVTGNGAFGVAAGRVKTLVHAYAPPGMQNLGVARDGAVTGYHPATDTSYPVSTVTVELGPGESTVVTFGWLGSDPFTGDLAVETTPLITSHDTGELIPTCEHPLW